MPTRQNRNKKPLNKSNKDERRNDQQHRERQRQTDQSLHRPFQEYHEQKTNTDPSQQIGEFSDWAKKERPFND